MARWLVLLTVIGCGRIGFDTRSDGSTSTGDDSTSVDAPISNGLVAWWPLGDEFINSTTAFDVSGNNLHARCMTSCPSRAPGRKSGFASRFDGVTDILERTADPIFDLPSFTAVGWTRLERRPGIVEIVVSRAVGSLGENSFALTHVANGTAEFYSQGNSSLKSAAIVPLGTWIHLALTFDGTTKELFVNAASAGTMPAGAPLTYDSRPLTIGGDIENGVSDFFLQGTIADVMVFDRVLDVTELQLLAAP